MSSLVNVPQPFTVIINDFLRDMKLTFPEYKFVIQKYEHKLPFLFLFCQKKYISISSKILSGDESIFHEDSTIDTEFLPRIVFKTFWHDSGLSSQTKSTIWNYLRLIFVSLDNTKEKKINKHPSSSTSDPDDMTQILCDEDEDDDEDDDGEHYEDVDEDEDAIEEKEKEQANAEDDNTKEEDDKYNSLNSNDIRSFKIDENENELLNTNDSQNLLDKLNPQDILSLEEIFKTSFEQISSSPLFNEQKEETKEKESTTHLEEVQDLQFDEDLETEKTNKNDSKNQTNETQKNKNKSHQSSSSQSSSSVNMLNENSMDSMMEGIFGSSFLSMAKEIAEESFSSINQDEIRDKGIQGLFQQPNLFTNILSNLNTKLNSKMENGELKEQELFSQIETIFSKVGQSFDSSKTKSTTSSDPFASLLQSTMSGVMNQFMKEGNKKNKSNCKVNAKKKSYDDDNYSEDQPTYFAKTSPNNSNWFKKTKEEKIKKRLQKKLEEIQKASGCI